MFPVFHQFDSCFTFDSLPRSVDYKQKDCKELFEEKDLSLYNKEKGSTEYYEDPSLPHLIDDSKFCYIKKPTEKHSRTFILKNIFTSNIGDLYKDLKQSDYEKKALGSVSYTAKNMW